jgi:hypothetical protein
VTQDLRVALTTSLDDRLVGPLRRSLEEMEKHIKGVQKVLDGVTGSSQKAGQSLAGMQGPAQAARQVMELSKNTQNAVSLAEKLRSAWTVAGNTIKGVTSAVAAYQAAKYVMSGPLQTARSYDRQLADAANTAFSDRTTAGRQAGMGELDATVTKALRTGGGKREDVLAGLNEMLASGSVNAAQAGSLLPTVAKYATAGNASVADLSTIVVRALQSGFKEADIPKVLDMALAAGQKGGFELKDMAKWLPKLLAAGNVSGLGGMDGYARILASAQGAVTTAGSKDEAGNNLLNLLLKINAPDTANDAKKLGIDLSGSLAAARGKGVNSLDAFVNLVDQIAGKDSRMVALRKQATVAGTDDERKSTLTAQADILQGSAIGKIVQDRQALLALVAELNKRDYISGVQTYAMGANGQYGASNFGLVSSTADFRLNQQDNEKLFAQGSGLGGVNGALGQLAETATDLYRKYPGYAAVVQTATWAIGGLGAAALAAGGVFALLGKGIGGAVPAVVPGAVPAVVAPAAVTTAGAVGAAGLAGSGLLVGGVVLGAGYMMSEAMNSDKGLRSRIDSRQARLAELTELSNLDGGGNARLNTEIAQLRTDRDNLLAKLVGADEVSRELRALQNRPVQVVIDGQVLATSLNNTNERTARRN